MPWESQFTPQTQIPHSPVVFPVWAGCLLYLSLELTWQWVSQIYSPSQAGDLQPLLLFNKKSPLNSCRKQSQGSLLIPKKIHEKWSPGLSWQWSHNEGIALCPHVRLILPLSYLSKPTYLALNIKTSKYFKPRGHSSSSFHVFVVDEIIGAYHFPSTHTKKLLKTKVKRKLNFSAFTVFLMSDLFNWQSMCSGPWLFSLCYLYLSRWLCAY